MFRRGLRAATLRFRPIIMTAISTILGAVPIAFASGAGAETATPWAAVIVGGLSSTVLTLFVIPIAHILMDNLCLRRSFERPGPKQAAAIARNPAAESGPAREVGG